MLGLIYALLLTAYGGLTFYTNVKHTTSADQQAYYLLWTRSNPGDKDFYRLEMNHQSVEESNMDFDEKTYIMFHGYGSEGNDYWILDIKDEMLNIESANIISVDYGHLATMPDFPSAYTNSYLVANQTAILIDWMAEEFGLDYSKIHIIGYSLGAQTAGMTGAYVMEGKVDRITGLDPAGPYYYNASPDRRIDKKHAVFVDIIHTNSGSLLDKEYGLFAAVGHVDFYPNGGKHQPGCNADTDLTIDCSHARAPAFFLESIKNSTDERDFYAWPCSDWETFEFGQCTECQSGCQNMGMNAKRGIEGSFYLRTNSAIPYSKGDEQ